MTIKSIEHNGQNLTITLTNGVERSYFSSDERFDGLIAAFRHADEVGRLNEPDEIYTMTSGGDMDEIPEGRKFFDIEYLLEGEAEYRWGFAIAKNETDALKSFSDREDWPGAIFNVTPVVATRIAGPQSTR